MIQVNYTIGNDNTLCEKRDALTQSVKRRSMFPRVSSPIETNLSVRRGEA
jgi:hypothetical protein